jgi:hypothetical protein
MLVGLIHLLVSEPYEEDEEIGVLYLMLGLEIYRLDLKERRRKRRGGRYGSREPYQKNPSQESIDALIDRATDRCVENQSR